MKCQMSNVSARGGSASGGKCQKLGFTLLELIVAIGIIMTGILSVFGLFLQTSKIQRAQEGEGLALDLAQEGIEVVRSIRDSNWLAGCRNRQQPPVEYDWEPGGCFLWDTGLWQAQDGTAVALFDDQTNRWSLDFAMADTIQDNDTALALLDSGVIAHKYSGNAGRVQKILPLQRIIKLVPLCRDSDQTETQAQPGQDCDTGGTRVGFHVISTVRWNVGNGYEERSLEDRLYNWR